MEDKIEFFKKNLGRGTVTLFYHDVKPLAYTVALASIESIGIRLKRVVVRAHDTQYSLFPHDLEVEDEALAWAAETLRQAWENAIAPVRWVHIESRSLAFNLNHVEYFSFWKGGLSVSFNSRRIESFDLPEIELQAVKAQLDALAGATSGKE